MPLIYDTTWVMCWRGSVLILSLSHLRVEFRLWAKASSFAKRSLNFRLETSNHVGLAHWNWTSVDIWLVAPVCLLPYYVRTYLHVDIHSQNGRPLATPNRTYRSRGCRSTFKIMNSHRYGLTARILSDSRTEYGQDWDDDNHSCTELKHLLLHL